MRIGLVAPLVTPIRPDLPGGAQAFLADLAQGLAARGHEVDLHCAAGSEVPGVRLRPVAVEASVAEALVMPAGTTVASVPALRRGFEAVFEAIRRDPPDVLTVHAFDADAFELESGLPSVHTLHLPPIVPAVVDAARRSGARLVSVSAASAQSWAAAGVATVTIANGVPDFDPGGARPGPVALIAGRISPEKGVDVAIRCARRAGLSPLVVGSPYDPRYFAEAVAPLLREGELLGPVPRPELWGLMATSAVTLLAIDWEEPFGLVAAEAQVAGCPVAGFRRGALPEIVEEGVSGVLVAPGDEDALVAAIRHAAGLDRAAVRASARRRLLLGPAVESYARLLAETA